MNQQKRLLKKSLLPSMALLLVAMTNTVSAADLPSMPGLYDPSGPKPQFSWEGAYVGAQIGAGLLASEVKSGGAKRTLKDGSAAGGVYAGYNWQFSRFVLGLETDVNLNANKKTGTVGSLGNVSTKTSWSAGIKGRVGLPIDRFMPYLSLGVAASDYQLTAKGQRKKTNVASLTLGAGLEYALTDKIHLRADYSIRGLDNKTRNFAGTAVKNTAGSQQLMMGLSYKF
ncbi:outer membrane protein [Cohaesibacter gelatinilyticus]|uniref:Outer membrane immunogenic protein n=1 Tax=Cohaesibacter gelatinilyticus TaxID=372072 RepID=A0A285N7G5_9HYPH|nr:outer membrane protein [Cohaesibacter gelatinilyticus]SNZ05415.1 outer membrane immunogenic protein [Cohaesibacter gelatinilyticus]